MKKRKGSKKKQKRSKRGVAFEDSLDLLTMVHFAIGGREVGAYLLKRGAHYQLVFGFDCRGIHPILSEAEIAATLEQLEAGLKDLPPNESVTIHSSIFARDGARQEELSSLIGQTESKPHKLVLTSEQARVQELRRSGVYKPSSLIVYCTYTLTRKGGSRDLLGALLSFIQGLSKGITGELGEFNNRRLEAALREAFSEGCERWERLFSNTMGLKISSLSAQELWADLYSRFNTSEPVPIPQSLIVDEQGLREEIISRLGIRTNLTRCGVPQAGKRWVKVKDSYVAALTFIEKPGVIDLHYLYDRLRRDGVKDIEVYSEIRIGDSRFTKAVLELSTKQALYQAEHAGIHHNVDVGAQMHAQESVQAQEAIVEGSPVVYCSTVFFIYRKTKKELDTACYQFQSYFSRPAWVSREEELTSQVWLQTLPITCNRLLLFWGGLFDRRPLYLSHEVAGLLSLVRPRPCDSEGFELICEGGEGERKKVWGRGAG